MSEELIRITGTVQWFSAPKGYGFISPDDGSKDVFVHYSVIQEEEGKFRNLNGGDRVEMSIEETDKGPQAVDVIKL